MSKRLNLIIANAPLQSGNRGCVALTIAAISLIDKVLSEEGIGYNLYLPDAQIKSWDFHNSYSVLGKEFKVTPISYDAPFTRTSLFKYYIGNIIKKIKGRQLSTNHFKTADFILNIGQGDSYADIYGVERFNMINRANEIACYYQKPFCVLPQTIGPFHHQFVQEKAKYGIKSAQFVMARDRQSAVYAKNLVPQCNVKEYIDVAFFLPYAKISHPANKIHVGLNISALLWNGGYTKNNQFELKCDYQCLIRSIIDYFVSIPEVVLHLISHVVEPDPGIENDYEVAYNIWREYHSEKVVLAPFALSPVDIKSYIAGLEFFMGARMHATIGAFSSGVPVVPMAYSRKFNGLFFFSLDYHFMSDLKKQTTEEVLSTIKDAFAKRSELNDIINDRMKTVVKERERLLYDDLRKFFKLA